MLKTLKNFASQSWLLIIASFLFGLALALANAAWAPKIEKNRTDKLNRLMGGLLTEAATFQVAVEDVVINLPKGKKAKSEIYKAFSADGQIAGWAFNCQGSGFADKIELVIAVDADFDTLAGFDVLASNETPGFGDQIETDYYRLQFKGAPAKKLQLVKTGDDEKIDSEIVAVSGATVSSQAVVAIVNNYVAQVKTLLTEKNLID